MSTALAGLGIRLQICAGQPTVHPPELDPHETTDLLTTRTRLDAAYRKISHHEGAHA